MKYFSKIKIFMIFSFLLIFTTSLQAGNNYEENTLTLHIVNEKFSNNNPDLRDSVDRFLKEVWQESVSQEINDIQEVNRIALEKLNKKSGPAKSLYENGLRLANITYTPTSDLNETLSSIARYRGDSVHDWSGQEHPLMIIFSNYALEKDNLVNVQAGYDPAQGNVISFGISSEGLNGKSPQDIFYEWTSSFAEDKIFGTEKEKYSQGRGWRMAVIVNDTIVTAPSLRAPLRDGASISGRFTQREIQKLAVDLDESLLEEFPDANQEPDNVEQQEPEVIVIEDWEEYSNNLRLEQEKVFSQGIQKIEKEMKECKDPELKTFYEEMITLMHAMREATCNTSDDKSEMQAVVMRWTELYRKYHNKFDFNFQKNLIAAANMHWNTLDMYEVQDLEFRKEVIQWAESLVKKFPKEPSSYAVLASVKAMSGSKKDEVLSILEKGLALDPQNQECLNVMKNYR